MSKIMRTIYAEALAAREADARAKEHANGTSVAFSSPAAGQASNVAFWQERYANALIALDSAVAEVATRAVSHPCTTEDHVMWWRKNTAHTSGV